MKRWNKEKPTELNGINNNATACDRIPNDTKYTDTGSDTGSDTGTGTDILLKKETKNITSDEINNNIPVLKKILFKSDLIQKKL